MSPCRSRSRAGLMFSRTGASSCAVPAPNSCTMTGSGRPTLAYRSMAMKTALSLALALPLIAAAQTLTPHQRLARDIYKELIEINTVANTGDTAKAAEAMAARLRAAGFPADDV